MPNVTFILPVKNCDQFIDKSLESIQNQTFSDLECIIVYGASSDNTYSILNNYASKDKRFRIIPGLEKGLAHDLNLAINCTDSKYIFRLDADDIAAKDRIDVQLKYLVNGYDIVGSNVQYFGSFHFLKSNYPLNKEGIKFYSLFRNPFAHPSICFKRDLNLYYDPEYNGLEDYELWIRCLQHPELNIINVEESLTNYRVHKLQVTKLTDSVNVHNLRRNICLKMCNYMQIPGHYHNIFIDLANEKNINYKNTFKVIKLLNNQKNIDIKDKKRIMKEVILSTLKLNHYKSFSIIKIINIEFFDLFFFLKIYIILKFSNGPLSFLSRIMRSIWR
jgi:glycosyltransferase involved in cell wall biosynthesis